MRVGNSDRVEGSCSVFRCEPFVRYCVLDRGCAPASWRRPGRHGLPAAPLRCGGCCRGHRASRTAVFEFARSKTVVLTTPNREYNVMWETLPAGQFRHSDHRFEWTRTEFQGWANRVAEQHAYTVRFLPLGPEDENVGSPTQMGVFERM